MRSMFKLRWMRSVHVVTASDLAGGAGLGVRAEQHDHRRRHGPVGPATALPVARHPPPRLPGRRRSRSPARRRRAAARPGRAPGPLRASQRLAAAVDDVRQRRGTLRVSRPSPPLRAAARRPAGAAPATGQPRAVAATVTAADVAAHRVTAVKVAAELRTTRAQHDVLAGHADPSWPAGCCPVVPGAPSPCRATRPAAGARWLAARTGGRGGFAVRYRPRQHRHRAPAAGPVHRRSRQRPLGRRAPGR